MYLNNLYTGGLTYNKNKEWSTQGKPNSSTLGLGLLSTVLNGFKAADFYPF